MTHRFSHIVSSVLGFDDFFEHVDRLIDSAGTPSFPPSSVYKLTNGYEIEMALAGYKQEHVNVKHDKKRNQLIITGDNTQQPTDGDNTRVTVRQGIAHRKFTTTFTIADNLEVSSASLVDGMLKIVLSTIEAPEETLIQIPLG